MAERRGQEPHHLSSVHHCFPVTSGDCAFPVQSPASKAAVPSGTGNQDLVQVL